MTTFINPYYIVDLRSRNEAIHKLTIRVPERVAAFLNGVHGPGGEPPIQTTVNLLLKAVYERLQRNSITEYNPAAFERCVCQCVDAINTLDGTPRTPLPQHPGGSTPVDKPKGKTPKRDDPRRTPAVAPAPPSGNLPAHDTPCGSTGAANKYGNIRVRRDWET